MKTLSDLGPVYTETNLDQFPVEPFNTFSNVLFLIVAIYWYRKKREIRNGEFRFFLDANLPILLIGYVGGTLYHATRSYTLWMVIDASSIYVLAFFVSLYHWRLIGVRGFRLILIFVFLIGLPEIVVWTVFGEHPGLYSMGYGTLVLSVLLPVLIDEFQQNWKYIGFIMRPLIYIMIALGFRILDSSDFVQKHLTIGTHWLWHTFGALNCHFVLVYMNQRSLEKTKK